jgi:hypothetical protein
MPGPWLAFGTYFIGEIAIHASPHMTGTVNESVVALRRLLHINLLEHVCHEYPSIWCTKNVQHRLHVTQLL